MGFVLFDGPHPGTTAETLAVELRWTSGGRPNERVVLEYRTASEAAERRKKGDTGGWSPISKSAPNTGLFVWSEDIPAVDKNTVVEVRIRAIGDVRVNDILEVTLYA